MNIAIYFSHSHWESSTCSSAKFRRKYESWSEYELQDSGPNLDPAKNRVVSRFFSSRFHPKSRRLFPFYFSNITFRTDLLTFGVTSAVSKIAGEMLQLLAYFDNPGVVDPEWGSPTIKKQHVHFEVVSLHPWAKRATVCLTCGLHEWQRDLKPSILGSLLVQCLHYAEGKVELYWCVPH